MADGCHLKSVPAFTIRAIVTLNVLPLRQQTSSREENNNVDVLAQSEVLNLFGTSFPFAENPPPIRVTPNKLHLKNKRIIKAVSQRKPSVSGLFSIRLHVFLSLFCRSG